MEYDIEKEYNNERKDRELFLFDKGFTEMPYNEQKENTDKKDNKLKKGNINWFTVYLALFKNTLNSKNLVPKEELKLRLNIIRKYLPPYYNCQKNLENSNTNSILKKFTYHLYSNNNLMKKLVEKKNEKKFSFNEEENEEEDESKSKEENNQNFERRKTKTKTEKFSFSKLNLLFLNDKKQSLRKSINFLNKPLKIIDEYNIKNFSPAKRSNLRRSSFKSNEKFFDNKKIFNSSKKVKKKNNLKFAEIEKNVKFKFDNKYNDIKKNFENNNKDIIIRTPNDTEYPLILTEKRMINNSNQTYFFDFLNKLNEETKMEKINTYKKEVTSQILKFNEMYFDTKMDDFSQDTLFNDLKNTCDMFINKFNFDNQEEKNLGDLDKFL